MKKSLKSRTKMVHAGHRRSQFNEVSEAVFLTQSYVYDSAEQAEARKTKAKSKRERKDTRKVEQDRIRTELDAQEEPSS